jgi:peptidoglycan/xylan/chitin deacetylase (PgdA/CDA1 family)
MPDNRAGAPDGHGPDWRGPSLGRRRMLVIAAGGVMAGLGGLAAGGCSSQVTAAADGAPRPAASPSGSRRLTPVTASGEPRPSPHQPSRRARAEKSAPAPVPRQPVYYLEDGPKVIALTIDDGPSPVYTPQVLRLLERYGVRATFSMIGESVSSYPAVARDVAEAGHTIINHTWDHANLTLLSAAAQRAEIERAASAIHAATGARPRMFRAPYGAWSREALRYCASERLLPLDWSVDPRDWARPGVSEIITTIMGTTRSGSIILEHDGGGDRSQTVAALQTVIPRLLDEGYRFAIP